MKSIKYSLLSLGFLALVSTTFGQSHGHINAGAIDTNGGGIGAGDKLYMYFEHGTENTVLAYNGGTGTYGDDGYLWNGNTTFTSLHQSSYPGKAPNYNSVGALSGSYLELRLVSVDGPMGAKISFYESGSTTPTLVYQIGTGWLSLDQPIQLTENSWYAGSPGDDIPSDPYGHIHGRMFAVDTAGTYTASWVLHDVYSGTTGLLDSDVFTQIFTAEAVPEPSAYILIGVGIILLVAVRRRVRVSV